ncbi:NAD(P)/FAD-dependent oxidoreductase [Mycolicibacterium goodii]|uniref:Pyridine nucleotide-disulfide oxidoreductase n=1 Tax=Mycolicibacterium goodii TaxID=134601 RepID=A0A0K0X2J7_MYCGD|nr:pyridine nucleotide-disulfide oxidoreductase [Mycolicibacterium goodii]
MTEHKTHSVVVIGGGYAGTLTANRLQQNPDVEITLINPRPRFVQRLRLHQAAAGSHDATAEYQALLGPGVRLLVDQADRIDTANRRIQLTSGGSVEYDYVVYAVGSTAAVPESVGGAAEFAHTMAEYESAQRLHEAVNRLSPHAWITVVGGGFTGIEMAAELAMQKRTVSLIAGGQLGPTLGDPARRAVAKWMTDNGVGVLEEAMVTAVGPDAVVLSDGMVWRSDLTIWAGGFGVPDLAARSGLRTDTLGRLITDETLTSIDDDRVLAAGDAAAPSGRALRMACYTAGPMGATAADTILSRIAGTPPKAFSLGYVGSCLGLGRHAAVMQFTRRDDTPLDFHLRGRIAGSLKEGVLKGILWSLRREGRRPGAASWLKSGATVTSPGLADAKGSGHDDSIR